MANMTAQTGTSADGTGVGPSLEYDAFISYRRGDGEWHARTLRQRLLEIRIPAELASTVPDRRLRIYLDQIYERATDDFFENTIKPALRASRHLIVVKSPTSLEALPDGRANWLVREIEYFRSLSQDGRSISVAIAAGDVSGALPARLDETHPNIERVDLRRWRWYRPATYDDQLMTLAATLHDIRPADMPALRREDARRRLVQRRRRSLTLGTAAGLLLIAIAAGVWQYTRAREAVAASVWNRLDFSSNDEIAPDELNALWEMRVAGAGLRAALVTELTKGGDRGSRMGRRPAPIVRALFLGWPGDIVSDVFDATVKATPTGEFSQKEALWHSCEALAREMPGERASAAIDSVLAATKGKTERLAFPTTKILPDKLTPTSAQAAFEVVLKGMEDTAEATAARHYWVAVRAFGSRATPDQATRTLVRALRAAEQTTEPDDLEMLSRAVGALPGKLSAQEAQRLLTPLLKGIAETTWGLAELGHAVEALANKLPPEQARTVAALVLQKIDGADPFATTGLAPAVKGLVPALDPAAANAALERLLWATARARLDFALDPLVAAIGAIASRLTPEQTAVAMPSVLETLSRTPADQLKQPAIDPVIEAFARRLTGSQAHTVLAQVVDRIDRPRRIALPDNSPAGLEDLRRRMIEGVTTSPYDPRVVRAVISALKDALTALEAGQMVSRLVNSLDDTTNPRGFESVEIMVRATADRLSPEQRHTAVTQVMRKIDVTTDPDVIWNLASMSAALRGQLVLPQVTPMLHRLMGLMNTGGLRGLFSITQSFRLLSAAVPPDDVPALLPLVLNKLESDSGASNLVPRSLSEALQEWLARGRLTEPQTRLVVDAALRKIANTTDTDLLRTLVALIVEAPGRLEPVQAQIALKSLLNNKLRAELNVPGLTEPRERLAQAVRTLAPELTEDQRNAAALVMRSELAWANTERMASAAAEALMELEAGAPREAYARAAVEALKYPAAAGAATDILLAALHRGIPQAPGKEGGLRATLDWIAREFPNIDLESAPRCPPPREPGLVCPGAGGR